MITPHTHHTRRTPHTQHHTTHTSHSQTQGHTQTYFFLLLQLSIKLVVSPLNPREIFTVIENKASYFSLNSHEMSGHMELTLKEKRQDLC